MAKNYDRKDRLYQKAKSEGYRSRAAYKLEELHKKFALLKRGIKILDLGAWPGGWIQMALKYGGPTAEIVGIDLAQIEEFGSDNVKLIVGDVRDEANLSEALEWVHGKFDLVLSDMSPKLSGIKEADRYGAVACAELALWAADKALKAGGNIVIKVFKGNETEEFVKSIRPKFEKLTRIELDSTRKTSNEYYLVGLDFKG